MGDGFYHNNKGGGRWRKSDRCHLRPCDTGGNSSEASTASGPHVALAGAVIRRGGVGGVGGVEGGGGRWHKASTLLAPVAGGHAYCKQGQRGRRARTLSIVVTKNDILCSSNFSCIRLCLEY